MKKQKPKAKKDGASPALSVTTANIAKRLRWLSHRMACWYYRKSLAE